VLRGALVCAAAADIAATNAAVVFRASIVRFLSSVAALRCSSTVRLGGGRLRAKVAGPAFGAASWGVPEGGRASRR
jgi:hypothetical protein